MQSFKDKNKKLLAKAKKTEQQTARIQPKEIGGPRGPEPTRYGDWERKGRCIDF